jgi:DNA-binding MarR family transcriptional regulator
MDTRRVSDKNLQKRCVCFDVRKAARAISKLYDDFLRPAGLRVTQFSLLMAAKKSGTVTVTRLSKISISDRTTLTRNLTVLEKKGLIRIESGEDRRERLVSLTDKGHDVVKESVMLWEKAQSHIIDRMGEDRTQNLLKELSDIVLLARAV